MFFRILISPGKVSYETRKETCDELYREGGTGRRGEKGRGKRERRREREDGKEEDGRGRITMKGEEVEEEERGRVISDDSAYFRMLS